MHSMAPYWGYFEVQENADLQICISVQENADPQMRGLGLGLGLRGDPHILAVRVFLQLSAGENFVQHLIALIVKKVVDCLFIGFPNV